MWRIAIVLIVGGGVPGFYGFNEFRLGSGASAEPEPISVAELEKGIPDNPHRVLGEHVPLYENVVYEEETRKGQKSGTGTVKYAYYAVMSKENPELANFEKAVEKVLEKYKGDFAKIPQTEIPKIKGIRVLIKTHAYKTVSALKTAVDKEQFPKKDLAGMVTNRVDSISSRDVQLIKDGYPQFDAANTVIFEVGRKPTSSGTALLLMFGGGVPILAGPGIWLLSRK